MKEIARLRELLAAPRYSDDERYRIHYNEVVCLRALPALLDRLEAAEAVVEAARAYRENDDDPGALAHALDTALRRYDEVRRG